MQLNQKSKSDKVLFSLKKFFDGFFNDKPEELEREDFYSLRNISKNFQISRSYLKKWIKEYLCEKYGFKNAVLIWNKFWSTSEQLIKGKKIKFIQVIKSQLKNYPVKIEKIESLNTLAKKIGISRRTITKWINDYLTSIYGKKIANEIYNEIWTSRKCLILITYNRIKSAIRQKGDTLITKEKTFNKMQETPSQRYMEVKCKHGHKWHIRINLLLYQSFWCPICKEPKTQIIMRMYMEKIYNARFPKTTLYKAYNISTKKEDA